MAITSIDPSAAERVYGAGNLSVELRDILVHIDASASCHNRLDVASLIGQRYGARVTGLFVTPRAMIPPYAVTDFGVTIDEDILIDLEGKQKLLAASAEKHFRDRLERDGVEFDWRSVVGSVAQEISARARYADLAIIGQPDPDGPAPGDQLSTASEILLTAGRPTVVVPYVGHFPTIGKRILIAWNESREAARAVNDALSFLARAKAITVLSINPDATVNGEVTPSADLALHLARHGVEAEATTIAGTDISAGDVLLARSADWEADLIVMGAYGHSRLTELVLGGATRSLLRRSTVPILMSH